MKMIMHRYHVHHGLFVVMLCIACGVLGTDQYGQADETVQASPGPMIYTEPCADPANNTPECLEWRKWQLCQDPASTEPHCVEMRKWQACEDPNNMEQYCIEKREWEACQDPNNMATKCVEMRTYNACQQNPQSTDPKCVEMRKWEACKDPNSMEQHCIEMRKSDACRQNPSSTDPFCIQFRQWQECQDPTNQASYCLEMRRADACKQDPNSTDQLCIDMRQWEACQDQNNMDAKCVEMRKAEACQKDPASTDPFCVGMRQWEACQDANNMDAQCIEMRKGDACKQNPDSTDPYCQEMRQYEECKNNPSSTDPECVAMRRYQECESTGFASAICQQMQQARVCKDSNSSDPACQYMKLWISCLDTTNSDEKCLAVRSWEQCMNQGSDAASCQKQLEQQLAGRTDTNSNNAPVSVSDKALAQQYVIQKYGEAYRSASITIEQQSKPEIVSITVNDLQHIPRETVENLQEREDLKISTIARQRLAIQHAETDTGDTPVIAAENVVVLGGQGPADTEVTIHIYSDPIVLTTRTNSAGEWVYTLDSAIPSGRHEAYVTVGDETAEPIARSSFFSFVLGEAEAADTDITAADSSIVKTDAQADSQSSPLNQFVLLVLGFLLTIVFSFLLAYRVMKHKMQQKQKES
ncbi:MAG TPA: hypothetical protein PKL83_02935 [bacterium]|nr:hypothetical protein [bacterium]